MNTFFRKRLHDTKNYMLTIAGFGNWFNNLSGQGDYDLFFLGTGSYPCVPQGWHLEIRFIPSQMPLNTPHSWIASIVYCEQDGRCLQLVASKGESVSWYKRIGRMNNFLNIRSQNTIFNVGSAGS